MVYKGQLLFTKQGTITRLLDNEYYKAKKKNTIPTKSTQNGVEEI